MHGVITFQMRFRSSLFEYVILSFRNIQCLQQGTMMTSSPQIYAIFYNGSLERFQALKVDRAERLVIEIDTIDCTPAITNANINVVLR